MRRSLWLIVVLLTIASTSVTAEVSCLALKAASVNPGQDVSISCTNLPKDPKVSVVLSAKDQSKSAPLQAKAQDNAVTFTVPGGTASGSYSVLLTIDSKSVDVPGQLEVATLSLSLIHI